MSDLGLKSRLSPWLAVLRQVVATSPRRWAELPAEVWRYAESWRSFRRMHADAEPRRDRETRLHPALFDRSAIGFDAHYTFQGAWAARRIVRLAPARHVDVSSDVRFVAQLASHVPVLYVEYRPVRMGVEGLETRQGDVTSLPFPDRSIASLSCLHVVEHVGLGRYGDPLDPQGHVKACRELQRTLADGGTLLLSLPVGRPALLFNSHRILDPTEVPALVPELRMVEFSIVTTAGLFLESVDPAAFRDESYACGLYRMVR